MSDAYPVNVLGATRDVSPSGYPAWAQRTPSLRAQAKAALLPLLAAAYRTSRQPYGSPRITHWLRAQGQPPPAAAAGAGWSRAEHEPPGQLL